MDRVHVIVADPHMRQQVEDAATEAGLVPGEQPGPTVVATVVQAGRVVPDRGAAGAVFVAADRESTTVWDSATRIGGDVVVLPAGAEWLRERLRAVRSRSTAAPARTGTVVTVVGARGGAGATTVAVALARVCRTAGSVVLVDADTTAPGVDLALGLQDQPGIRWPDLAGITGALPVQTWPGRLPGAPGFDVLACRPAAAGVAGSWRPVLASLACGYDWVVVDLPRYRLTATPPPPGGRAVLVTSQDLAGVTSTRQLASSGLLGPEPVVVLRSVRGPLGLAAAQEQLTPLHLVEFGHSRALVGAADFGDLGESVSRGPAVRAARAVLELVAAP